MEKMEFTILLQPTTRIGRVRFNDESSTIYFETRPGGWEYDVDMKRCRTAEQALDWIHQLNAKSWAKPHMGDFLSIMFSAISSTLWSGKA